MAMNWPASELVLCAGGTDDTYEKACRMAGPRVKVLRQQPGEGKQSALRKCLDVARYDIIHLTDADCLFQRQALENLLHPLVTFETRAATGWTRPLPDQIRIPIVQYHWARDCYTHNRDGLFANGVLGGNAAISRGVLIHARALEIEAKTGIDYVLSQQLALLNERVRLVKDSILASDYPTTSRQYVRLWRRWIKNLIVHDARGQLTHLVAATVLASLILALPIEAWVAPRVWTGFSFLLFLILIAKRYQYIGAGYKDGIPISRRLFLYIPYFAILDQIAVIMAIADFCSPRRRHRW